MVVAPQPTINETDDDKNNNIIIVVCVHVWWCWSTSLCSSLPWNLYPLSVFLSIVNRCSSSTPLSTTQVFVSLSTCLVLANSLNDLECDLQEDCRHQHPDSCTTDDKTQLFVGSRVSTSPSLMEELDPTSHWVLSNLRCDVAGFVSASRCGSGTTPQGHYGQQLWHWPCHTIELCEMLFETISVMLDGFSVQVDTEPFQDNAKSNSCGELSRDNNNSILRSSYLLSWCCKRHDGTSSLVWSSMVAMGHEEGRFFFSLGDMACPLL